jgi:hypothetical protein
MGGTGGGGCETWLLSIMLRPLVMRTSDSALLMRLRRADVSGWAECMRTMGVKANLAGSPST